MIWFLNVDFPKFFLRYLYLFLKRQELISGGKIRM